MSDEQDERPGFRVTDRRRFADSGEARAPDDASGAAAAPPESGRAGIIDAPVSFSTFVLGLSTQALMHLGEVEHPVTGARERDLPAAKHVIDVLGVLMIKTAGNLDSAEHALMDSILYDLRMRYVELSRGGPDPKDKEEA